MNVVLYSVQDYVLRDPQAKQLHEYYTSVFPPINKMAALL